MKLRNLFPCMMVVLFSASLLASPTKLSPADEAAAFKAAGFKQNGKQWRNCEDSSPSYTPGAIEEVRDLNGDGRLEAVITESSSNCYGNTEAAYSLVGQQTDGTWKLISQGTGVVTFLSTKGAGGWPDMEVGGPGFCFPVLRWNGKEYVLHGHQYEGKPCKAS
jgi:hypothetical protein